MNVMDTAAKLPGLEKEAIQNLLRAHYSPEREQSPGNHLDYQSLCVHPVTSVYRGR